MTTEIDQQSEAVIFKLLEDDLRMVNSADDFEIWPGENYHGSVPPTDSAIPVVEPPYYYGGVPEDIMVVAQIARDRAYAQRLAAGEQKFRLDGEFAKKLQDQGGNATDGCDADSLLGQAAIDEILASDPNKKGKVRDRASSSPVDDLALTADYPPTTEPGDAAGKRLVSVYPACGICGDAFTDTHSPILSSLSANSSTRLPFGLHLPCPNQHSYCIGCLSQYIICKLDPDSAGGAREERIVFPIRCPECPLDQWLHGIPDDVAERILTEERVALWHRQKYLDSLPRYYCPNRQCSALVQLHEKTGEPQTTCPLCKTAICVPCKTQWHNDLTCKEYQALPADQKTPEDRLLIQLAREKKWRRCRACGRIIELIAGCSHMTCRCGRQFCFTCGGDWGSHNTCVASDGDL